MNAPGKKFCMALSMILALIPLQGLAEESSASTASVSVPVYRPPLRGAPVTRVGGASRGGQDAGLALSVLAPLSTGWTVQAQPTLYWYSSKGLSALEFTLIDEQAIKPLVEMKVNAPQAGIHGLKLKYSLKPEVEYQWNIAAVADPSQRAGDTIASGTIRRAPLPATLAAQLESASPQQRPFLYAQEGFWYDAIMALSQQIEAHPTDHSLREQRAALLTQVGLTEAAAFDGAVTHP